MPAAGSITPGSGVPVAIGRNPQKYGVLDGVLDQVRIYNRRLSAAEIVELYSTLQ
jgi:hypothetical protein